MPNWANLAKNGLNNLRTFEAPEADWDLIKISFESCDRPVWSKIVKKLIIP